MSAPHSTTLRIVTWNIHKGVRGFGLRKRLEIHAMKDAVAAWDADLICLQEVRRINHKEAAHFAQWPQLPQADFLAPSGYSSVYRTNAYTKHGEHGNALLSRYPVLAQAHEDMSDHRLEQRGLLHTTLQIHAQRVHCIVVHLGLMAASRMRQLAQLSRYMDRHIPAQEALIVAGDFNSPLAPQHWARTALQTSPSDANTSELAPNKLRLQRHCATFPSRLPLVQLDHVFVRHAKIISRHVPSAAHWARMSDHLPLIVEVQL